MQHTLVAVFDNRTDAQNALNELLSSGFTRTDVQLSSGDAAGPIGQSDSLSASSDTDVARSADGDTGITASIKNFFGDLFGSDNAEHVERYEGAVNRGHHVLTLVANSLPEVERGADIVERYGPTDIDETSSGTPDLASTGFSSGAMHAGSSAGMQQTSSMSAQSSTGAGSAQAAAIPALDNPGDPNLFQQQSLNTAEPMGTTYQEPLGQSGLGATGGTSLQGSTLQDNAIQGSALEGSVRQGSTAIDRGDSQQRSSGANASANTNFDRQRSSVRIFSRGQADAALGTAPGFDGGSGSSAAGAYAGGDGEYRNHFDATYGATGASYDEYAPAYSYGSEAARSGRYTNGAWDDIEGDLRSDWDSRYASGDDASTWDKMKAAVRHGWERMTGDDDDQGYRGHYDSNYAAVGEHYDELKPAYSYGSEMRRSEMYRNRPWDDVETDLRTGWDQRIDGTREFSTTGSDSSEPSAWDRVKNAVRHGWDKMADDNDNDNDDDVYYRNHWNSVYGSTGGAYDEYRPAYSYGTEMAREEKYRGRPWTDVETDLRSDWDNRYPGEQSTWDKMKSAVRHGWERMMR